MQVGNHHLEQINGYKYLGSLIIYDGKSSNKIKARIALAKTTRNYYAPRR